MFFMFLGHSCLHQLLITHTLALFSHVTFVFILSSTHLLSFSCVSFVFILLIHTCMQSYIPTSYYHIFSNIVFLIFFFPVSCTRAHMHMHITHLYDDNSLAVSYPILAFSCIAELHGNTQAYAEK